LIAKADISFAGKNAEETNETIDDITRKNSPDTPANTNAEPASTDLVF
jgi:hypothetical protein